MAQASGPQIAFLVFAVQFFAMLGARALAPHIGWPPNEFMLLGQLFSFAFAAAILFGTPALRRYCIEELRRPPTSCMSLELVMVSLSKGAIPFAIIGATVLWAFASGSVAGIADRIRVVDATRAWTWTLSPYGLTSVVLLSWLVGPVIEELVFRGLLYRTFERQWGWLASTMITSILFGLMHPSHVMATALGSVVLVCVLRRTGSLPACIFVHAVFNMIISWPLLGRLLFAAPPGDPMSISSWTFHIACLGFVSGALPAYFLMSLRDARSPASP